MFKFRKAAENENGIEASGGGESESHWEELEKRDSMLESLLILLNSAASLGFGPNPMAFSSDPPRPFTSEFPGKKFVKDLNEISAKTSNSISHYQLV